MATLLDYKCKQCGAAFQRQKGISGTKEYCSAKCRIAAKPRTYLDYTCEYCGDGFQKVKGYAGKHRFCSPKCQHASRVGQFKKGSIAWNTDTRQYTDHVCEKCGAEFQRVKGYAGSKRFCSLDCNYKGRAGKEHPNWKGGRWQNKVGYWVVNVSPGVNELEHVVIAEKALGRTMKRDEIVHHINGDKTDNDRRNLLVCTNGYHRQLHARMSYLYQHANFPSYR